MFLSKTFIDQIRYVAYVPRMAGNQAVWWGLSHLEPPKSQPTLVELKSSQVGVPTCLSERVFWIGLGMLPMCRGWHGTMQIGGGLSHFKTPK